MPLVPFGRVSFAFFREASFETASLEFALRGRQAVTLDGGFHPDYRRHGIEAHTPTWCSSHLLFGFPCFGKTRFPHDFAVSRVVVAACPEFGRNPGSRLFRLGLFLFGVLRCPFRC
jgi:hypothetical protein